MVPAKATRKPPWYWHLWPRFLSFVYICEDKELHYVTLVAWMSKSVWRRDIPIVHLPKVLGMLYGFDAAMAFAQPTTKSGEGTTH